MSHQVYLQMAEVYSTIYTDLDALEWMDGAAEGLRQLHELPQAVVHRVRGGWGGLKEVGRRGEGGRRGGGSHSGLYVPHQVRGRRSNLNSPSVLNQWCGLNDAHVLPSFTPWD